MAKIKPEDGALVDPKKLSKLDPDQHVGLKEALEPVNPLIEDMLPPSVIAHDKLPTHKKKANELYTKANVAVVLRAISIGMPQFSAAAMIGVKSETISRWKARHPDFGEAIDKANALNQQILLDRVYQGMGKHPRLALDLLDRRHPEHFAQTKRVENTGTVHHEHSANAVLQRLQETRKKLDQQKNVSSPQTIEIEANSED